MMVLYSGTTCPYSQRCRFVLFEKGMDFEIRDIDLFNKPEDIATMNPYGQVPILVERDLILYESNIIDEYIDEPVRDLDKPFLMPIEDVFSIKGRGTVATGRIEQGIVKVNDAVEIVAGTPKAMRTGVPVWRWPSYKARHCSRPMARRA